MIHEVESLRRHQWSPPRTLREAKDWMTPASSGTTALECGRRDWFPGGGQWCEGYHYEWRKSNVNKVAVWFWVSPWRVFSGCAVAFFNDTNLARFCNILDGGKKQTSPDLFPMKRPTSVKGEESVSDKAKLRREKKTRQKLFFVEFYWKEILLQNYNPPPHPLHRLSRTQIDSSLKIIK